MFILELSVKRAGCGKEIAEVLKAVEKITTYLREKGGISAEEEIVQYGLSALFWNVLSILTTVLVGSVFVNALSGLMLWLLVFPLRKYAGGYHAKTRGYCFLISVGMMLCAYAVFTTWKLPMAVYMSVTVITFGAIFCMAPVDTPNKLLDVLEQGMYRKRARVVLVTEGIVFISACVLRYETLYAAVTMSYFIVAVSLVAGKVTLNRCREKRRQKR